MQEWQNITVAVGGVAAAVVVLILLVCLRRRFSLSRRRDFGVTDSPGEIPEKNLQIGISKLTPLNLHNHDLDIRARSNSYYVLKPEVSPNPRFNWSDHPSLITDAVENGWSRFAFAASHTSSSPSVRSTRSTLLGSCGAGDRRESDVEITWEICQGSADFLQKIRLNSGLKRPSSCHSVIKTGLPLPGPQLGNSCFPQEAYFEITVVENDFDYDPFGNRSRRSKVEGEKAKLIQEKLNKKLNYSEWRVHVKNSGNGNGNNDKVEEMWGGKEESDMLTVGLSRGGVSSLPLKVPGSYWGSIGFNSDGSVYLDGIKLIFKSEKAEWGKTDKVVGCGYNPSQRKVFFTVDSQLVHVINCKSDEFDTPLYPTLASNIDTTFLVNFGQSVFKYAPANSQRTPNPCFIGPLAKSPALSYEDSKELFSMGRIDSQWLNRNTTRNGHNSNNNNNNNGSNHQKGPDFDVESEGDLFEIVLDSSGRSPNTVLK